MPLRCIATHLFICTLGISPTHRMFYALEFKQIFIDKNDIGDKVPQKCQLQTLHLSQVDTSITVTMFQIDNLHID